MSHLKKIWAVLRVLFQRLGYIFAFVHEGMHWLAARVLGLKAKIVIKPKKYQAYCMVGTYYDWQVVFVALAPATLTPFIWLFDPMFALAWAAGCLLDFALVAKVIKSAFSQ